MERRVLLAISLSFLVLFAFQALLVQPPPSGNATPMQATVPPAQLTPLGEVVSAGNATTARPILPATPAPPIVGESEERDIVVET